jgi:hypothetical protein
MSKKDLEKLTCDKLAKICKDNGIVHYHNSSRFKKDDMVKAILKMQRQTAKTKKEAKEAVVEEEIEKKTDSAVEKVNETAVSDKKEMYLDSLKLGTLIAFREYSGRLNTAAVQNVSYKRRQIKLITQYKKEFIINFDDVVWVRTGKRWPKFVMSELKGGERNAVKQ